MIPRKGGERTFPNSSPYGTHRIIVPLNRLGLEGRHLFFLNRYDVDIHSYVVLAALRDEELGKVLKKLDWNDNKWLEFNTEFTEAQVANGYWVELFVEGSLTSSSDWIYDTVRKTGRNLTTQ